MTPNDRHPTYEDVGDWLKTLEAELNVISSTLTTVQVRARAERTKPIEIDLTPAYARSLGRRLIALAELAEVSDPGTTDR